MANPDQTASGVSSKNFVDHIVHCYGDMLFDLCESILWSPVTAQINFRWILRRLKKLHSANRYSQYERAWVLRITCERLLATAPRQERRLTPSEQIMLDASLNIPDRVQYFDSYFHRLTAEEQLLLLLRDKYGLPYPEIAAALGKSEGSLKVKRQQALRALEEWLWDRI